jgi:hypothetical protein
MDGDDLYGLPLERFIPERAALARELRSAGRRQEATAVAALRKPSIAAWAVNQLVRGQRRAVTDLLKAGDALRDAQSGVLAGHAEPGALRRATERERAAVDVLLDQARRLDSSEGHELSPVILERVADTLHAAALGEDARALVSPGRLERELRHVGLGDAGLANPARPPSRGPRAGTPNRRASESSGTKEHADAAKLAARQRAKALKVAQARETEARRHAERADRAVRAAEQRRERAAQALRQVDEELARAQAEAEATADAHRQAKRQLEAL